MRHEKSLPTICRNVNHIDKQQRLTDASELPVSKRKMEMMEIQVHLKKNSLIYIFKIKNIWIAFYHLQRHSHTYSRPSS